MNLGFGYWYLVGKGIVYRIVVNKVVDYSVYLLGLRVISIDVEKLFDI